MLLKINFNEENKKKGGLLLDPPLLASLPQHLATSCRLYKYYNHTLNLKKDFFLLGKDFLFIPDYHDMI